MGCVLHTWLVVRRAGVGLVRLNLSPRPSFHSLINHEQRFRGVAAAEAGTNVLRFFRATQGFQPRFRNMLSYLASS